MNCIARANNIREVEILNFSPELESMSYMIRNLMNTINQI